MTQDSPPPQRKIVHVDMDAFYASVEQRDNEELRGKPVVVGGSPQSRGVVCSASYEARAFGVRSAIPCSQALRLCPDAVFVRPHFDRYREVSHQIRAIFLRHTPLVEPLSLDEAYLDVTQELTGLPTATATAEKIRAEILEETRLTASAGVAPNKFLAKIASDWRKPNGQFVIRPHQVDRFLLPLAVGKLPGVGRATEKLLTDRSIRTVGDLRTLTEDELSGMFGKFGRRLFELARGIDERPVVASRETKSIGSEETFEHDRTLSEVESELPRLADDVWRSLEKKRLTTRTITVKLRESRFRTETRRITVESVPDVAAVVELARSLLQRFSFPPETKYRLVGLTLSNFNGNEEQAEEESSEQPSLFTA